jgi:urea transport system permease protein
VRDSESRARFLGYRVESYKLFVFTVSAMLAGLAGALYVPQIGIINPGEFSPANSIEIVIWVALGGRGTLVGAALGAVIVTSAKSYLTATMPDLWLFVLGAMFVFVTIFLPRGVLGVIEGAVARARRPRRRAPPAGPAPEPEPVAQEAPARPEPARRPVEARA